MASIFSTTFPVAALHKVGIKFGPGLYALCLVLLITGDRTCKGAKLGSRSFEYEGVIPYNSNTNYYSHNAQHYNHPYSSNENENQSLPKAESLEQQRLNSRHAVDGVIHGKTFMITLYQWNNHLGRPATMEWTEDEAELGQCKSIPIKYTGKVRSLNTHNNCVVLYSRDGCRGAFRIFKVGSPSHNRLSDLCFHKKPSSARPCTPEEENGNGRPHRNNSNHL